MREDDEMKLRGFVGPSLKDTFVNNYFPNGDEYLEAIQHYRVYYSEKGIFENKLYEGIQEVLSEVYQKQGKLALATAKPTYFANIILKHFKIDKYFEVVVGSHLTGTRTAKKEIIFEVLDQFGHPKPSNIYMIGDREYDIIGGKHHGLKTIGVSYGYGKENELEQIKPDVIVNQPKEILKVLDLLSD